MGFERNRQRLFLEWQPEFELGLADIDDQHRQLRERVNALADAVIADDALVAADAVADLLTDSQAHFEYEEALMGDVAYPGYELHEEQHAELLASMQRLHVELSSGRIATDSARTLQFLRDWFSIHIVRTDAPFADYLRDRIAQPA